MWSNRSQIQRNKNADANAKIEIMPKNVLMTENLYTPPAIINYMQTITEKIN